jgi:hypothetical protein
VTDPAELIKEARHYPRCEECQEAGCTTDCEYDVLQRLSAALESVVAGRPHVIEDGSGRHALTCDEYQDYVEAAAWYQRCVKAEAERDRLREALGSAGEMCARAPACGAVIRAALADTERDR